MSFQCPLPSKRRKQNGIQRAMESHNSCYKGCILGRKRTLGHAELICFKCKYIYHLQCLIAFKVPLFPFTSSYIFVCAHCAVPNGREQYRILAPTSVNIVIAAAAYIVWKRKPETSHSTKTNSMILSWSDDLKPFIEANWQELAHDCIMPPNWQEQLRCCLYEKTLFEPLHRKKRQQHDSYRLLIPLEDVHALNPLIYQYRPLDVEDYVYDDKIISHCGRDVEFTVVMSARVHLQMKSRRSIGKVWKKGEQEEFLTHILVTETGPVASCEVNVGTERHFIAEPDPVLFNFKYSLCSHEDPAMSAKCFRIINPDRVMLSPIDSDNGLQISNDMLTVTGCDGYRMARATHPVSSGTWYYEVLFLRQPPILHAKSSKPGELSCVRIGWSKEGVPLGTCVGFGDKSYGCRSKHGSKVHGSKCKTYAQPGYKAGDVLGVLIHLPCETILPNSGKDGYLKRILGFPIIVLDSKEQEKENMEIVPGSKIEFFLNGESCGVAFKDIYKGLYFPAVSMFHDATLKVNFGPDMKCGIPSGARPMCERVEEFHIERAVSDLIDIVDLGMLE